MQNKPSSKVIQILTNITEEISMVRPFCFTITALCEDGSIWQKYNVDSWHCILEAPTQPKSDLPEVGSRWRNKECHSLELTVVEGVRFELISSKLRNSMSAQDFLNIYEPIPTQSDNKE
jgi:hypothetical protein